jgi:hypothetical protein
MHRRPGHRRARLLRLSRIEWGDLLRAQAYLIAAQVLIWTRPVGRLVLHTPAEEEGTVVGGGSRQACDLNATRLAAAVRRAADHGLLRPRCLVRAVALNRMLEGHDIRGSRIRIGVRVHEGRFAAHAWVELGGRVLGDFVEHTGRFTPLLDGRLQMPNDYGRRS